MSYPMHWMSGMVGVVVAVCASAILGAEGTHLFVDDAGIARKEGVVRRAHAGTKLERPVLEAERPWEGRRVYLYGTVLYDAGTKQYRMWYMTRTEQNMADKRLTGSRYDMVCYATSDDGISWARPNVGLYEWGGSKENNIVFALHSPSVILDPDDPDASRRYKMLGCGRAAGGSGYCAAVSPDGLNWTMTPESPVLKHGDTITLAHDRERGEYLAFHKIHSTHRGERRRLVYLATSKDFRTWSEPRLILPPDERDETWVTEKGQTSQFYNASAFAYGGQFLGMITHFRLQRKIDKPAAGQSSADGPIDAQLIHSRDGKEWLRCEDRSAVIANGPHGYDAGCILGVGNSAVAQGEEVAVYYTAITTTHGGALPEKKISIARAAWARDRFVSLDAEGEGVVETVGFEAKGEKLSVNAVGSVAVEVIGEDGKVIPGYSASECEAIAGDQLRAAVRWKERAELPRGRGIRLRFVLRKASLYAYSVGSR